MVLSKSALTLDRGRMAAVEGSDQALSFAAIGACLCRGAWSARSRRCLGRTGSRPGPLPAGPAHSPRRSARIRPDDVSESGASHAPTPCLVRWLEPIFARRGPAPPQYGVLPTRDSAKWEGGACHGYVTCRDCDPSIIFAARSPAPSRSLSGRSKSSSIARMRFVTVRRSTPSTAAVEETLRSAAK